MPYFGLWLLGYFLQCSTTFFISLKPVSFTTVRIIHQLWQFDCSPKSSCDSQPLDQSSLPWPLPVSHPLLRQGLIGSLDLSNWKFFLFHLQPVPWCIYVWLVMSWLFLTPWDFPERNNRVGICHFFLQGIVPTQGLNPALVTPSHRRTRLPISCVWTGMLQAWFNTLLCCK